MEGKLKRILDEVRKTHNVVEVDCFTEVRVPPACKIFFMCGGIGQKHFYGKAFLKQIANYKNLVVHVNGDNCSYIAY